jgi:hypothetical protein
LATCGIEWPKDTIIKEKPFVFSEQLSAPNPDPGISDAFDQVRKQEYSLACRRQKKQFCFIQIELITIKKQNTMKTTLSKWMKQLLVFGFAVMAGHGAQAFCSASTTVSLNGANLTYGASLNVPAGWHNYIYVDYGDGGAFSGYSYLGANTVYNSTHQYTMNGMHIISTYIEAYDPADTMNYCYVNVYDTVWVSSLPCSVNVGTINYSQNGMLGGYTFSTTVSASNTPAIYWVVIDSLNNTVYTQTGGTSMNFNFPQNGYYQVQCAAYVYDSTSVIGCADTSFLWLPVYNNPTGGCNLQVGLNINPNAGLSVNIQGTANAAYQYSYVLVDNNVFYNTSNVNYTFPGPGYYNVCFYAEDTTAASYCYDSVCVMYNATNTNPPPCNASFYMFQDSLNPTVWYAINNSNGSPAMTYMWDFGDGTISSQMYPTHVYSTPGNYIVCLTVSDPSGCTSTYCDSSAAFRLSTAALMGSISVLAPTGIKDNNHAVSEVKIFPNPMADLSSITFNSTVSSNGKLEVIGLLGNTVLSQEVNIIKGNNEFKMNMAGLANGAYYVKIVAGSEVLTTLKAVK